MKRREFLTLMGTSATALALEQFVSAASRRKMNFVFILADDLGWADVGCYGGTFYETPNIDKLCAESTKFTNAYAAAPVCSPTRGSIMTGKYPARTHVTNYIPGQMKVDNGPILPADYKHELDLEEVTLAEALKSVGYTTALMGKWHLGLPPHAPAAQGFDTVVGGKDGGNNPSYFWPKWRSWQAIEGRFEGEYLTDRLTEDAVDFIEESKDKPFFLYLAHFAPHVPIESKEEKIAKYRAKLKEHPVAEGEQNNPVYAGMIESLDESVGRVLGTLRRLKLDKNTVVIFFSDNGGSVYNLGLTGYITMNTPLRASKGHLYEGGIRECCIIKWPGVTKPGTVCIEPIMSTDFFRTLSQIAGSPGDAALDGLSLVPLLKNPAATLDRPALYWHYPHYSPQYGRPASAIRMGDWKLIEWLETGKVELFNLKDDVSETADLSEKYPKKTRELLGMLVRWRKEVNTNMPKPNPDYDPSKPIGELHY